jgi:opacity protein-like surface antigen
MPLLASCLFLLEPASAQAQFEPSSGMPRSAFYFGGGGGYAFGQFGTQSYYNKGYSETYQYGSLVAVGTAGGPPVPVSLGSDGAASPVVQFGYYQHLGNTDWLLGVKASYNYLGLKKSVSNVNVPQAGTSTANGGSTFSGNAVTNSYSVDVRHQFASLLYAGRSFGNGYFYAGGGLTFSQMKLQLNDVIGYATLNGVLTNISGAPQSFSDTDWRVGGAVTVGMTYFVTPSWFVDVSYLVSFPDSRTFDIRSPFNNPGDPYTYKGLLTGTATSNVQNIQSIMVSLNKAF